MYKPRLPEKPKEPKKTDETTVVSKTVCYVSDRCHYFPGWSEGNYYEEEEENTSQEVNPKHPHRIRMIDVIEHLPHDVSVEDLYFTASFSDDYLNIDVCYDKKVSLYDEQMKKYNKEMEIWNYQKAQYDKDILRYEAELKEELASIKK